jgi:hypothetical protein
VRRPERDYRSDPLRPRRLVSSVAQLFGESAVAPSCETTLGCCQARRSARQLRLKAPVFTENGGLTESSVLVGIVHWCSHSNFISSTYETPREQREPPFNPSSTSRPDHHYESGGHVTTPHPEARPDKAMDVESETRHRVWRQVRVDRPERRHHVTGVAGGAGSAAYRRPCRRGWHANRRTSGVARWHSQS